MPVSEIDDIFAGKTSKLSSTHKNSVFATAKPSTSVSVNKVKKRKMTEGEPFRLTGTTKIIYPEGNEKMERNAAFLADYLELSAGIKPKVTVDAAEQDAVIL